MGELLKQLAANPETWKTVIAVVPAIVDVIGHLRQQHGREPTTEEVIAHIHAIADQRIAEGEAFLGEKKGGD